MWDEEANTYTGMINCDKQPSGRIEKLAPHQDGSHQKTRRKMLNMTTGVQKSK
jgi:hypothetical protein